MVSPIPFSSRTEPPSDLGEDGRAATFRAEAANEPFARMDDTVPIAGPGPMSESARFALSLTASLMLHLATLALISSSLTYMPVKLNASPPLTVKLAQLAPDLSVPTKTATAPVLSDSPPEPLPLREAEGSPTTPARFLADPDLSVLEEIPTTFPGIVSLRLHVNAQGRVERITVERADPVPKPLLDGLVDRFGHAKLSPALIGNQPTASTLEVTIRVDPPVHLIDIGR